jgi:hypothetical protein
MCDQFFNMIANNNYFRIQVSLERCQRCCGILDVMDWTRSHPKNLGALKRGKIAEEHRTTAFNGPAAEILQNILA